MTTEARAAVARRNGARSRGPRTDAGKARSSTNALRHGLTARATLLLPGESPKEYRAFADGLRASLAPVGSLEGVLADRVISAAWRLRRLGLIEAGLIASELHREYAQRAKAAADKHVKVTSELGDLAMFRTTRTVLNAEKHAVADEAARVRWAAYEEPVPTIGRAFAEVEAKLTSVSRYQTSIERSLYAALHELERAQARRGGAVVQPPATLDVTVTAAADPGTDPLAGDGFVSKSVPGSSDPPPEG